MSFDKEFGENLNMPTVEVENALIPAQVVLFIPPQTFHSETNFTYYFKKKVFASKKQQNYKLT